MKLARLAGVLSGAYFIRTWISALVILVCLPISQSLYAENQKADALRTPEAVVNSLTSQLLDMARSSQQQLKEDPEAYYSRVEAALEPLVSFRFIAKNVMGDTYWKQSSEAQRAAFLGVFKRSLVETYTKGMSQNLDYDISLLPDESSVLKNHATIVQKISGSDGSNHVVYSLGLGKSGQWKVLNVVLDGVNLGKTFRSQFAQGVKESKGDLDAAIGAWSGKS